MYNDKLPDMSAAYAEIQEKMAKKDHDGDGKIETGKEEYFGARDKAIKKAMKKEHHEKDAEGNVIPHDEDDKVAKDVIKERMREKMISLTQEHDAEAAGLKPSEYKKL